MREMAKPEWAVAIYKPSGMHQENYVVVPVIAHLMRPGEKEPQVVELHLMIAKEGAERLVQGLEGVLEGPPPPEDMHMPGAN